MHYFDAIMLLYFVFCFEPSCELALTKAGNAYESA
jgi:hypothetical protein